ncbi:peptidoglycan-binding protein [Streptomyces sp. NPDC002889]|uniref:peptidoglycan-binding domain-containing protein n=1 Tax=Streptomyces sp. NPDC002889 TaxID=3364669 RepID=UPI0036BDDBCB
MGDALQAGRHAQMAAEEFDPLRIRPYVTLEGMRAEAAGPPPAPIPQAVTQVQVPVPAGGPGPLPDLVNEPDTQELELVRVARAGQHAAPPRRSRAFTGLMAGAAAVAVAGTVAFAGGLFSGDGESERAAPDSRATATSVSLGPGLPSASVSGSAASPSVSATSSSPSSSSSSSSAPASGPASGSAAASRSAAGTAPGGSGPADPSSVAPSTTVATASALQAPSRQSSRDTLRPGDSGPAVEDLQLRLEQLRLYEGPFDGEYDGEVEDAVRRYQWARGIDRDPEGVYGKHTRRALESETRQP